MINGKKNLIPVLLGADLNAYSVALSFYEAYGVKSHVFARYRCGATDNSKFITTHICSGIDDVRVAVPELLRFAHLNSGGELFLIPCADWYVVMLESAQDMLSDIYHVHIPERNVWNKLSDKHSFYQLMQKEGILYPKYQAFLSEGDITFEKLGKVEYPAVLKPSDSTEYWKYPFDDMRKVYFVKNTDESVEIMHRIFSSGYRKAVILQELVGKESGNMVLTTFSDKEGRVVRAVLGDVILEEVGKTSYGNHSAIITQPLNDTCRKLIEFLNRIRYTGVANVDIMSDGEREYVLEINTRQGRSCDYLRAAGISLAELFVKTAHREKIEPSYSYSEAYWHYPPHKAVMNFSEHGKKEMAEDLMKKGAGFSPYQNSYEGIVRRAYVAYHNTRLARAIKKSHKKSGDIGSKTT